MRRFSVTCLAFGLLMTTLVAQQPPAGAPAGAPPPGAQAQPDGPKIVEVERLKDNLYLLKGGGGHSLVFITQNNGVVVADTKNPGWGKPLLDKIREITNMPVSTVVNSHVHGDHTSGNVDFPSNITIVAHANTKTNMEKLDLFKGDNAKFLPNRTFQDKLSLFSGADQVDLYYFGRGGTDGDIWVVIPALRTIFAGDAFSNRAITNIDRRNGGNAGAYLASLTRVASEIKGVDTVVTGHGPVLAWSDLQKYAQFNREFQEWVRMQKQAGRTVDEVAASYKHSEQYKEYEVRPAMFIRGYIQAVYDEAP